MVLRDRPDLWLPDNLLTLQEYFAFDSSQGIVRMEFLNGELLYAMRVVSHGRFNLCPSESCNPEDGGSQCGLPLDPAIHPVGFYPYKGVPAGSGANLRSVG